jgi:hypothetical protein
MLEAQDVSAIDPNRSRVYTLSTDPQNTNVSLTIFELTPGYKMRMVPLPMMVPSLTPGLGQGVAVSPIDGTIILMGHDATRSGHHSIYTCDPATFALTFLADIGGTLNSDLLGAAFAYDHDARELYVSRAYNDSGYPSTKFDAVSLATGHIAPLNTSLQMAGLVYDSQTRRMYGTHAKPGSKGAVRMLAYFETSTRDALTHVASLPLNVGIGNIHAFDRRARVHYTLLAGNPPKCPKYVHTDFCADHGEPCAAGTSCCCEPPCTDKAKYGVCYTVASCDQIPTPGGDPYKVPSYLVGMSLATGHVVRQTPICSEEPSNATVNAPCPWSVEAA